MMVVLDSISAFFTLRAHRVSPHLLRCGALAVPSTASYADALHLRQYRFVNKSNHYLIGEKNGKMGMYSLWLYL